LKTQEKNMSEASALTAWQKKQATILYHYASFDYLKGLQQRFNELMAFIDPTLDLAEQQNRDQFLANTRWGMRDTSENWGNNAWPFLKSFQKSITKAIAHRAFEIYGARFYATGARQDSLGKWRPGCGRATPILISPPQTCRH
jgi:trans-aconitate methyltransferase